MANEDKGLQCTCKFNLGITCVCISHLVGLGFVSSSLLKNGNETNSSSSQKVHFQEKALEECDLIFSSMVLLTHKSPRIGYNVKQIK